MVDTSEDREMIENPSRWPRYPLLPLIKRTGNITDDGYCGIMVAEEPLTVRIGILFTGVPVEKMEKETFKSLDDLLQVWRVD